MAWTLVTGGAKRLGAQICRTLAENGHDILVHFRTSNQEAMEVVENCRSLGVKANSIRGDFSNLEATQAFIETLLFQYPDIENLINNVGNFLLGSALETGIRSWIDLFQTNLHTPLLLTQGVIASIQSHAGSIINIGSAGVGVMKASRKFTAYTLTKSALLIMTKSLARELAPSNVRVNMVSPGELDISVTLQKEHTKLPMRRAGSTREVARVIAYLLQKENAYITGQNIEVAGGVAL